MKFKLSAIAASAVSGLYASAAHAKAVDHLTIIYTSTVAAVPLSPWMVASLGVALAGATAIIMRKRGMGQGVSYALAVMIGVAGLGAANQVYAAGPTPHTLLLDGTGSNAMTFTTNDVEVTVTNTSASSVTITAIDLHNYIQHPLVSSTCVVGTVLAPAATCTLGLQNNT